MLKAIFFDYHGVLDARSYRGAIDGYVAAAYQPQLHGKKETYIARTTKDFLDSGGRVMRGDETMSEQFAALVQQGFAADALESMRQFLMTLEPDWQLWELARQLRQKYFVGILSDATPEKAELIARQLPLAEYFDVWHFSCHHRMSKAGAEFFGLMCQAERFRPQDVLFIDDISQNIERAASLGFQTHHYTFGDHSAARDLLSGGAK